MASNQKYGRNKRAPSNKRYMGEKRWEVNKSRRIKREAEKQSVLKNMSVPRGTARAKRRAHLQRSV